VRFDLGAEAQNEASLAVALKVVAKVGEQHGVAGKTDGDGGAQFDAVGVFGGDGVGEEGVVGYFGGPGAGVAGGLDGSGFASDVLEVAGVIYVDSAVYFHAADVSPVCRGG